VSHQHPAQRGFFGVGGGGQQCGESILGGCRGGWAFGVRRPARLIFFLHASSEKGSSCLPAAHTLLPCHVCASQVLPPGMPRSYGRGLSPISSPRGVVDTFTCALRIQITSCHPPLPHIVQVSSFQELRDIQWQGRFFCIFVGTGNLSWKKRN
jgi:hypothetical protein